MSPQLEFLRNVILSVRGGDKDSANLLRQLCQSAVDSAPVDDLLVIADCLLRIGLNMENDS
jgi:hypothetical protein